MYTHYLKNKTDVKLVGHMILRDYLSKHENYPLSVKFAILLKKYVERKNQVYKNFNAIPNDIKERFIDGELLRKFDQYIDEEKYNKFDTLSVNHLFANGAPNLHITVTCEKN